MRYWENFTIIRQQNLSQRSGVMLNCLLRVS